MLHQRRHDFLLVPDMKPARFLRPSRPFGLLGLPAGFCCGGFLLRLSLFLFLFLLTHLCAPRGYSIELPHFLQVRAVRPSARILLPILVCFLQFLHTMATFEIWIAASFSTIPPLMFFCGFGRVCRLIIWTPSTTMRSFFGLTISTRPVFPRSLPLRMYTSSFFLIGGIAIR